MGIPNPPHAKRAHDQSQKKFAALIETIEGLLKELQFLRIQNDDLRESHKDLQKSLRERMEVSTSGK